MRGHIKLGHWVPFHARQMLAPRYGFEWAARAGGVLTGFDRYVDGEGQMCWKLLGLLPVVRARGPDLTRSAAGRAAAEAIWLPTTLLPRFRIRWTALDDRHLAARCDVDAVEIQAHYSIDADGRLLSMVFDRWGDPERSGTWGTASLRWRDHRLNHLRRPNDSERGAVQMVLWDRPVERRRVLPLSDHRTAPERVGTGGLPRTLAVTIGTVNTTV
jgi:hypothetical protein